MIYNNLQSSRTWGQSKVSGAMERIDLSSSHLFAVEVVEAVREHLVDAVGVGEGDEAESPAPLRGRVLHHHHLGNVAKLAEILLQAL